MESLGDLLMGAARGLRREYAAATAVWQMTPGKARALRVVAGQESVRLSALAEILGIVPRSATEVVDALESLGYVAREPDLADRRATLVVATDEGRRVLAHIEEARSAASERYFATLSDDDRAELRRVLAGLTDGAPGNVGHVGHALG